MKTHKNIISRISNHVAGYTCICGAWHENECGCLDGDWRSRQEIATSEALKYCLAKLKSYHTTRPGITETIRATEEIRDAGITLNR